MTTLRLRGRITSEGTLEVDLPTPMPAGEAEVTIEISPEEPWSQQDLEDLLRPEPLTGREIVAAGLAGGWEDLGIPDGQTWVEAQRRRRQGNLKW
jgi:hypothetical protein